MSHLSSILVIFICLTISGCFEAKPLSFCEAEKASAASDQVISFTLKMLKSTGLNPLSNLAY